MRMRKKKKSRRRHERLRGGGGEGVVKSGKTVTPKPRKKETLPRKMPKLGGKKTAAAKRRAARHLKEIEELQSPSERDVKSAKTAKKEGVRAAEGVNIGMPTTFGSDEQNLHDVVTVADIYEDITRDVRVTKQLSGTQVKILL